MMRRRALLGMAGFGAAAAVGGGPAAQAAEENEYATRVRSAVALGLGKGQGASLSVVWLPRKGPNDQLPPRLVELVIFDLSGNRVAGKQAPLLPFAGASVDVVHHKVDRRSVYGYVFVDEPFDDIFAGLEIYDVSSGHTKLAIPVVVP